MSLLDKALQFATQAIAEDSAQNYQSAYRLYGSAVSEMELAYHSLFIPSFFFIVNTTQHFTSNPHPQPHSGK